MTKSLRPINGQTVNPLPTNQPITPVKTQEQLILEAENERLKAQLQELAERQSRGGGLTCKRSEKGAVSVYGLGRWPVTLYWEQWEKLAAFLPTVLAFIKANRSTLSTKE